jgi:hypothetical protein
MEEKPERFTVQRRPALEEAHTVLIECQTPHRHLL